MAAGGVLQSVLSALLVHLFLYATHLPPRALQVWVWGALHSYQPPPPSSSSAPSAPETSHWRGYHRGAVGAVACLPHRPGGQLASAGADGCVKLWAIGGGQLLAVARLGWQVGAGGGGGGARWHQERG